MTSRKRRLRNNDFDHKHFIKLTKRRFKKKFGKKITAKEINKIWKDWVQYRITENLLDGRLVKIDKHSTMEVVGFPILQSKTLTAGKVMRSNGAVMVLDASRKRPDFQYKIVYKNTLAKEKIYFKADVEIRRQLRDKLENTSAYFRITNR